MLIPMLMRRKQSHICLMWTLYLIYLPMGSLKSSSRASRGSTRRASEHRKKNLLLLPLHMTSCVLLCCLKQLKCSNAIYFQVDRHVRSLDLAIKAEEASFALGLRPGTQPNASLMQKGAGGSSGHAKKFSGDEGIQSATSGGRPRSGNKPRRPRPAAAENEPTVQPPPQSPNVDANGVALAQQLPNMAIDPNEPRYCYCNQVSFGEVSTEVCRRHLIFMALQR